jgi:seryl-tRNA synthetase
MKKMFNNKEFLKNISELLEKPFANFGHKLKRSI